MHPYIFLISHAIFHPGYVSVTIGGLTESEYAAAESVVEFARQRFH